MSGAGKGARFPLGRLLATPGALRALAEAGQSPEEFLARHRAGDWGDLDPEDRWLNEQALRRGWRLFSAYRTCRGARLWVITEGDRSATTLLLPEEY